MNKHDHRDQESGQYASVPKSGEDYSEFGAGQYEHEENYNGVPLGHGPENAPGPGRERD